MGGPQNPSTTVEECPYYDTSKIKALINKIKSLNQLVLNPQLILKLFKLCCEFNLSLEKIDCLEIEKIKAEREVNLDKKYYVSNEDIVIFGIKQGIVIKKEETDIIYNYIKNDFERIINNPNEVIIEIKDKVSKEIYQKILELYDKYNDMLK